MASNKQLYKLHSEGFDDFSSSESLKIDSEDENKPLVKNYEELKRNLVVFDGRRIRNYESDLSDQNSDVDEENLGAVGINPDRKFGNLTPEKIQKELESKLTKSYCFICKKKDEFGSFYHHYNSGNHLSNVHYWLVDKIANLKKPIDIKYLFCEACNLPLDGNEAAKNHYNTKNHLKNLKNFCTICSRGVPQEKATKHLTQAGHLKHLNASLEAKNDKNEEKLNSKAENNEEKSNLPTNSYANALKKHNFIDSNQLPVTTETVKITEENGPNFVKLSAYLKKCKNSATPESISKKFTELMDENHKICQFCPENQKMNKKHLKKCHFDSVFNWLQKEIEQLENPVNLALFFCEVCNLPLSGQNSALKHYDSVFHLEAVKSFCKVCHKSFTSLLQHNQSNKHLKALSEVAPSTSKKEEAMTDPNQLQPIKQYQRLANYVLRFLDQSFCYLCNVTVNDSEHYKSQSHMQTLKKWLEKNSNVLELFGIENLEELVCIGCKIVLHDSHLARVHYSSEEHQSTMQSFCKKCLVHEKSPYHKEHNKQLDEENSKKKTESSTNVSNRYPSVLLAVNLRIMLTPTLCEICNVAINENNYQFHYKDRNHVWMIRNWLAYGMRALQIAVDPRLVYCEACNLVLSGTLEAPAHYTGADHLANQPLYCPHCIFKGTPESILYHFLTPEHQQQFDNSIKLQNEMGVGTQQAIVKVSHPLYSPLIGTNLYYQPMIIRPQLINYREVVANFVETVSQRGSATNWEESQLQIRLDAEIKRLLELLYCSGKIPLKDAVNYLTVLNQKISNKINKS